MLESLRQIRYEKVQRRRVIINLCVAAYPDIQPWQIKRACLDPSLAVQSRKACSDDVLRELYYSYLSQLLDPVEGQEAARQSAELIKVRLEQQFVIPVETLHARVLTVLLFVVGMV